jgi:hypothetical protein
VIGDLGMAHMGMSMHSLIESSNQIKSNRMYIILPSSSYSLSILTFYLTLLFFFFFFYLSLYFSFSYLSLYSPLLSSTLLYSTLLSSTLLYSPLLYSTLLYSTLLYSTLLYSTPPILPLYNINLNILLLS